MNLQNTDFNEIFTIRSINTTISKLELYNFVEGKEPSNDNQDFEFYFQKWYSYLKGNSKYTGFNWSAFFLGYIWGTYRKLYLVSIILFFIEISSSILISTIGYIFKDLNPFFKFITDAPYVIAFPIIRITFAFLANKLYLRKTLKKIVLVKTKIIDQDNQLTQLKNKGGVDNITPYIMVLLNIILNIMGIISSHI